MEQEQPPNRPKRVLSEETKRKMSEVRKGVPKTPEHAAKINMANTGKKRSEETRKLMSEKRKAYWETIRENHDDRTEEG